MHDVTCSELDVGDELAKHKQQNSPLVHIVRVLFALSQMDSLAIHSTTSSLSLLQLILLSRVYTSSR